MVHYVVLPPCCLEIPITVQLLRDSLRNIARTIVCFHVHGDLTGFNIGNGEKLPTSGVESCELTLTL